MSTHRNMRIRNRTVLTLLFPATILFFSLGFLLQQLSQRNFTTRLKPKPPSTKTNGIQIHIATQEEHEETEEYS